MIVTTSWDDGHPDDLRVAELLSRYDLAGTFYVPVRNREGRPTMDAGALRQLDQSFEIGSHTYNHAVLTELAPAQVEEEIASGKSHLEAVLGHAVPGFCYPRGRVPANAREVFERCGIEYARTVEGFRSDSGDHAFAVPTTLQVYPHTRLNLLKNYVRHGAFITRFRIAIGAMVAGDFVAACHDIFALCRKRNAVFICGGIPTSCRSSDYGTSLKNCFVKLPNTLRKPEPWLNWSRRLTTAKATVAWTNTRSHWSDAKFRRASHDY